MSRNRGRAAKAKTPGSESPATLPSASRTRRQPPESRDRTPPAGLAALSQLSLSRQEHPSIADRFIGGRESEANDPSPSGATDAPDLGFLWYFTGLRNRLPHVPHR